LSANVCKEFGLVKFCKTVKVRQTRQEETMESKQKWAIAIEEMKEKVDEIRREMEICREESQQKSNDKERNFLEEKMSRNNAKRIVEELSAQVKEKEALLSLAGKDVMNKELAMNNAIKNVQWMVEERRIIIQENQQLKIVISQKDNDYHQIRIENNRLAEIICERERKGAYQEGRAQSLEYQLRFCQAQLMKEIPRRDEVMESDGENEKYSEKSQNISERSSRSSNSSRSLEVND
jgi:hypothetical protein